MSDKKYVEFNEEVIKEMRQRLYEIIPKEYFQERFGKRTPNYIKILLVRETTGYLIIRSTEPDEVISTEIGTKEVVVIPSRKLKSREKLTGLLFCRKFGVVHPNLEYNFIKQAIQLANPNSVIFGDSVTESGEAIGLPARVLYEWSYSLRPKNEIIEEFTHNALNEEGTMWDKEKGAHRESLYDIQYVKPGVYFPQFITFTDITPEGFLHVMLSIIKTVRYGAQSNVMDANMKNHIVAVALDEFEPAISSYVLSRDWNKDEVTSETNAKGEVNGTEEKKDWNKDEVTFETIKNYAIEKLRESSKEVISEDNKNAKITKLIQLLDDLLNNESKLREIYRKLLNDAIEYLLECKIIKKEEAAKKYVEDLKL